MLRNFYKIWGPVFSLLHAKYYTCCVLYLHTHAPSLESHTWDSIHVPHEVVSAQVLQFFGHSEKHKWKISSSPIQMINWYSQKNFITEKTFIKWKEFLYLSLTLTRVWSPESSTSVVILLDVFRITKVAAIFVSQFWDIIAVWFWI